jgi:hypothetical protein
MRRAEKFSGTRVNPNRVYHNTTFLDAALDAAQKINFRDIDSIESRHQDRLAMRNAERLLTPIDEKGAHAAVARLVTEHRRLSNSLGVSAVDEHDANAFTYVEVIPKDAAVPCEYKRIFSTSVDDQSTLHQPIHMARDELAGLEESDLLGTLIIENIEPAPAGTKEFETTFSVNAQGYLTVTTRNLETNRSHEMVFEVSQPYEYDPLVKRWRDRKGQFTVPPDVLSNVKADVEFEHQETNRGVNQGKNAAVAWKPLKQTGSGFNLNTSGALTFLIIIYGVMLVGVGATLIYILIKSGA